MTKKEISRLFDIPLSTVNDWQKEDSTRHKLYEFLRAVSKKEYQSIKLQQKNHRLLHILNRNIDKKNAYGVKDIKRAFLQTDFNEASDSQQVIYSKFFKECDSDDLKSLVELFDLSIRDIKKIYISSPLRKLKGVREVWDKRFRIKSNDSSAFLSNDNNIPAALAHVLEKRTAHV
jgi:hypothetical protein